MSKKKLNGDLIRSWTKPATKALNDELYALVALGDVDARERMIHANMGLVISEVDKFLGYMPKSRFLRDDLISEGLVGLVEAVNKMVADGFIDDANATALMSVCIQTHLGKLIEAEETIRIPTRTKKRKGLQPPEKTIDIDLTQEEPETPSRRFFYDPRRMDDLRQTLDACCENDTEREILRFRELGRVDREIAEELGIPLTTIFVMRRTLYARFLELSGWKGAA